MKVSLLEVKSMKMYIHKRYIYAVLSLFLGSNSLFLAMERTKTTQQQPVVQKVNNDWLKPFELKSLVQNPKYLKLNDCTKVRDAANLLLFLERILCAFDQMPKILSWMHGAQNSRFIQMADDNKLFLLSGFGTLEDLSLKTEFTSDSEGKNIIRWLRTPEGISAALQIRQIPRTSEEEYFDAIVSFASDLLTESGEKEEVRTVAGMAIHIAAMDLFTSIMLNEWPDLFSENCFSGKKANDWSWQDLKETIKKELSFIDKASLDHFFDIPFIEQLLSAGLETSYMIFHTGNEEGRSFMHDSLIVSKITKTVEAFKPYRAQINKMYQELYDALHNGLKGSSTEKQNEYLMQLKNITVSPIITKDAKTHADLDMSKKQLPKSLALLSKSKKTEIPNSTIATIAQKKIEKKIAKKNDTHAKKPKAKLQQKKQNKKVKHKQIIPDELSDEEIDEPVEPSATVESQKIEEQEEASNQEEQRALETGNPIRYAQRIEQYFQPNSPLDLYHGFTRIVDSFLFKYGQQEEYINRTYGSTDIVYKLAGEIRYKNNKREYVVWHATMNNRDICYHRGYELRTADMFDKYIADQFWKLKPNESESDNIGPAVARQLINDEGEVKEENKWAVKIWDKRLQATHYFV